MYIYILHLHFPHSNDVFAVKNQTHDLNPTLRKFQIDSYNDPFPRISLQVVMSTCQKEL